MANFLQPTGQNFANSPLYTPDFGFLSQVYAAGQAKYDRGFNMVKNLRNSLLNSPVSNADNEKFRMDAFNKLDTALKSISGVDLSNATNVQKAMGIMDPISKDPDLAYDMGFSNYMNKERSKMESIKNSNDIKIRSQYSQYAEQYLNIAYEEMSMAKRGDGSIRQVKPKEFVPFEDVNDYLNKAAKEQGIEIKLESPDGRGYIIKKTNGETAIEPFTQWAKSQMGERFNRQFDVMATVEANNAIKSTMQKYGVNKQEAMVKLANELMPKMMNDFQEEANNSEYNLADVESSISLLEKLYPQGFTEGSGAQKQYNSLVATRDSVKDQRDNSFMAMNDLKTKQASYIVNNLTNILASKIKDNTALGWGFTYAIATTELEIDSDATWLAKMNDATQKQLAYAKMDQDERHHKDRLELDYAKLSMEKKIAQSKGELASEEAVGPVNISGPGFATDMIYESIKDNQDKLFKAAFSSNEGLVNMIDPTGNEHYDALFAKLQAVALGELDPNSFTAQDKALLNKYGKTIGDQTYIQGKQFSINSKAQAQHILTRMAMGTYIRATKNAKVMKDADKQQLALKGITSAEKLLGGFRTLYDNYGKLEQEYKRIHDVVSTNPELYENIRVESYTPSGVPIYDMTKLSEAEKNMLSGFTSQDFQKRENAVGNAYNFKKLSDGEIKTIVSSSARKAIDYGSDTEIDISNMNPNEFRKVFGDQIEMSYDANSRLAYAKLRPITSKDNKITAPITITFDYDQLKSYETYSKRFSEYAEINDKDSTPVGGLISKFRDNKWGTYKSSDYSNNAGVSYTVAGVKLSDGGYGLKVMFNINGENYPYPNQNNGVFRVDVNNISAMTNVQNSINTFMTAITNKLSENAQ